MKHLIVATLLGISSLFLSPAHAVVVQQTYTGTVSTGADVTGVFGTAGANLAGASFTAVFKFDTALGNTTSGPASGGGTFIQLAGGTSPADPYLSATSPLLSATLSIGGSAAVSIPGGFEDRSAIRSFPGAASPPSEYLSTAADSLGNLLSVFIRNFDVLFPGDFTAVGEYLASAGAVTGDQFRLVAPNFTDAARGSLSATRLVVSIDAPVGETPIPGALPLFASGIGAFALVTYRRKRKQAA